MIIIFLLQFPPRYVAASTWMALHGSQSHSGFNALRGNITSWNVKYTLTVTGNGESEASVADVNADGIPDIVVSTWSGLNVYVFRGDNGTLIWNRSLGASGHSGAPVIADILPSRPGLEIITSTSGNTYLLSGTDGSTIWNVGLGSQASPMISYEGTDTLIVVFNSSDSRLYALRASTGSTVWYQPISGATYITPSPAIGDLDGGGDLEVAVQTNNTVHVFKFRTGTPLWSASISTAYLHPVSLGDLNGDGLDDVIAASRDIVYAFRGYDGAILWTRNLGSNIYGPPTIIDANGDGFEDVVIGVFNLGSSSIYVLNNVGTTLWLRSGMCISGMFGGGRVISDFDSDGSLELFVIPYYSCSPQTAYMFDLRTGSVEWSHTGSNAAGEGLSIADVDGDDCIEIIIHPPCCGPTLTVVDGPGSGCGVLGGGEDLGVGETQKGNDAYRLYEGGVYLYEKAKIYDVRGRKLFEGKGFIPLNDGVYYILLGKKVEKIIIK